ncbi:type I restriction enzyme M protein [Pseudonocardia hierapolitana]|uniref:Type I restriction enzyme M protein n=2 Tax=Pseudonocardia hierapolitana TaxID=1128676 RepID=A0A561SLH8_9PSEU|nr:type I restriction enzyme M protein [Pseudonocardia hierapolitana]
MFAFSEIAEWLGARRIPKNGLRPDEHPGTTYGDRFLRNSGMPIEAAHAVEPPPAQREPDVVSAMWSAMDKVRGFLDIDSAFDLFEALLILKLRHRRLWRGVTQEPRSDVLRDALDRALQDQARISLPQQVVDQVRDAGRERVLSLLVHVVDAFAIPTDKGDVARFLLELQGRMASATGRRGDTYTPLSVTRVMVGVTAPTSSDRVYDPFCRSGELLLGAALHVWGSSAESGRVSLTGHAASERHAQRTSMSAALAGIDIDVIRSMVLEAGVGIENEFDVVLANPPFGLTNWTSQAPTLDKRWRYGEPPPHNANFAWLQHAAAALRPGGRAAVLMANAATTTENRSEAAIRARMVEAGVVECVIALPPGLFTSTGIPVTLWILRVPRQQTVPEVLFVDATHLGSIRDRSRRELGDEDVEQIVGAYHGWRDSGGTAGYEPPRGLARSARVEEIRERRFVLNPRSYVETATVVPGVASGMRTVADVRSELTELGNRARELDRVLDDRLSRVDEEDVFRRGLPSGWQKVLLGDVCDILAGPGYVARLMGRESPWRLVVPRTIRYNALAGDTEFVGEGESARLSRYRLDEGDVVCVRTGEPGRVGLVAPAEEGWFLGPGCIRLRPRHPVDSSYLTYYLGTPEARDWIDRNSSGSAVRSISSRTLADLPVALPAMPVQQAVGGLLGAVDANAMLHDRLGSLVVEVRELLLASLVSGLRRSESD